MATMPSRLETVEIAIGSLINQVDRFYLFLDHFEKTPGFANHEKIVVLTSEEHGDVRSAGKLLALEMDHQADIYMTVDDDILYPKNFTTRVTKALKKYDYEAVIGLHGCILHESIESYRKDRTVIQLGNRLRRDQKVDVIGSGAMAFSPKKLRFDVKQWRHINTTDLQFALEAKRRGLPLYSIARKRDWARFLQKGQPDSIYNKLIKDDSRQTVLARELQGSG